MPSMYTAVYSHKNAMMYESEAAGISRMLVHSAVEIMSCEIKERKEHLFIKIIEYNGLKVSGLLLENGYRVLCVFQSGESEKKEMEEVGNLFRQKVLQGEFNRFEF
ncbi:hypothetical protein NEPAR06_2093 [Nematocida parisii]|uniref:Uncharacterized protein n=1 Tax=Nematocida parisii (strain ERTm3) TaxID=935791 RepID=I3EG13_NEMP3|nr:uncharacterized protein NEPG_01345 [Nematocida parisii ERTm1]EIJ88160.1 hypothetical protein NEQG_01604 [Nematocida parisii ERTm3]KAI5130210.1 hypothetical protein NEPAR08_1920 [Nematocida parisii]EIJ93773.1 hypothetical protein NEPG_01345 [Nematocida parisii ERTm1]KAI5130218.1 hypothetical protein NEPAR03_2004 [Nematocida parisii]KAI5143811.1 hypothetical protein NEPAR04_1947 [Nematocida parisii]|eukprot:XP_013059173.1 hypothetical protein NEPG_01345 [Nematocida parisii ERTm1]